MTNEQQQVKEWMQKFGQETPEKPAIPDSEIRRLRAKLILEEALETIEALGFHVWPQPSTELVEHQEGELITLQNIADGCEDLKVVTEGTLIACGLIKKTTHDRWTPIVECAQRHDPLFDEVMRSNNSKLWTRDELEIYFNGRLPPHKRGDSIIIEDMSIQLTPINSIECYLLKNKDGKVVKPPSYSPPSLESIIKALSL